MKQLLRVAGFSVYSLFSSKVGFTVFFKRSGQWFAYSRGRTFAVAEPRLWTLEYFRHFLPSRGAVVFDVGGELGVETAQFSGLVGDAGKVLVFECMPDHIARLERLAAELGNVQVVRRACWNAETTLEFFIGNTPGSSTAIAEAQGQRGQQLANPQRAIQVQAQTLDQMWQALHGAKPVDFLKMDIEGAEYEALEGASAMLQSTRRAVIAAYHIRDGVPTAARVASMLQTAGFRTRNR